MHTKMMMMYIWWLGCIIEVCVDDIIFGSDDDSLSQQFSKDMHKEFEMPLLGELTFLLGLQISQRT